MRIEAEHRSPEGGGKEPTTVKHFTQLSQGDRFTAQVVDIQPGRVTIRLDNGNLLTAKSQVLPEARIGEKTNFLVKENHKGQIFLEMEKSNDGQLNLVKEALRGAGLALTKENIAKTQELMQKGQSIDSESLRRAIFMNFIRQAEANTPLKDLLKNLLKTLESQSKGIEERIKEGSIKGDATSKDQELLHLLKNLEVLKGIKPHELLNLTKYFKSLEELSELLKQLKEGKLQESKLLEGKTHEGEQQGSNLRLQGEKLSDSLDFMKQVKQYLQFPVLFNEPTQAELFILKDGKAGRNQGVNLLLALDLNKLGKLEAYITKLDKSLSLHFKCEKENCLKLAKENSDKINKALQGLGYQVLGIRFSQTENNLGDAKKPEAVRYSFDMRI